MEFGEMLKNTQNAAKVQFFTKLIGDVTIASIEKYRKECVDFAFMTKRVTRWKIKTKMLKATTLKACDWKGLTRNSFYDFISIRLREKKGKSK